MDRENRIGREMNQDTGPEWFEWIEDEERVPLETWEDPYIVLFVDSSRDSVKAFKTLEDAQLRFKALPSEQGLYALWDIMKFKGLVGIENMTTFITRFDADVHVITEKYVPDLSRDPKVAKYWETLRQRQLEEAHAVLSRIQSGNIPSSGSDTRS